MQRRCGCAAVAGAPPTSAEDLELETDVLLEESSAETKAAAIKNTADGQSGEAMCYRQTTLPPAWTELPRRGDWDL